MLRSYIGNVLMAYGRTIARSDGRELAVDLDNNTIDIQMVRPDREQRAWDPDLYHRGCVFVNGYANPVKPIVEKHKDLEEPDEVSVEPSTITVEESSETATGVATDGGEERHVEMISSERYQTYMIQHLIEQLLNPDEQWKKLWYTLMGIGALLLVNAVLTASAAGVF